MSDTNLRKALIRLANAKPHLRKDLLPLLAGGPTRKHASNEKKLTDAALQAAALFRRSGGDHREWARDVAYGVGGYAFRHGIPTTEVSRWLQSAYGRVWVREGGLNPGADMREIRKWINQAYAKVGEQAARKRNNFFE